jgi:hypothetical protein
MFLALFLNRTIKDLISKSNYKSYQCTKQTKMKVGSEAEQTLSAKVRLTEANLDLGDCDRIGPGISFLLLLVQHNNIS